MKQLVLALLALVISASAYAQDGMKPLKTFEPDQKVHDFGTIKERDGKVSHTFTLTNKGKEAVVINNISAWCGCTSVDYTKQPIRPGEKAKVTVTYNPRSHSGKFSKEIAVITGGGKTYTRLWVKGSVISYLHPVTEDHPYAYGEGLYMNFEVLSFPPLKKGKEYTFTLMLANDSDKPMNIKFVRQPNNRVLSMVEHVKLKAKERTTISVSYRAPKTYKYNRHITLVPYVNDKKLKELKVTFAAVEE